MAGAVPRLARLCRLRTEKTKRTFDTERRGSHSILGEMKICAVDRAQASVPSRTSPQTMSARQISIRHDELTSARFSISHLLSIFMAKTFWELFSRTTATSPKAPRPITLRISKSLRASRWFLTSATTGDTETIIDH